MSTVAPRLDVTVSEARRLAGLGLAGATGLARTRWVVIGVALAIVGVAVALLVKERDPVLAKLALAPIDDEPVTPEERAAIDAAEAEESEIPWEEAKRKRAVPAGTRGKATT